MLFRTPSIQPKHSATCTDSGQMMLGFPELFLWKPTNSSWNLSWCDSNQARKSDGVGKNIGFADIVSEKIKPENQETLEFEIGGSGGFAALARRFCPQTCIRRTRLGG